MRFLYLILFMLVANVASADWVLVNNRNEVIERASNLDNLVNIDDRRLTLLAFDGDALIGDKIVNGSLEKVDVGDSERARIKKQKIGKKDSSRRIKKKLSELGFQEDDIREVFGINVEEA